MILSQKQTVLLRMQAANVEEFLIVVQLDEDGEFFQAICSSSYRWVKSILTNKLSFRQCFPFPGKPNAAMGYDPSDGEIRAIIGFLGRFDLTERQFNRCLRGLVQIVDSVAILGSNR